jgi:hypothetical protein
MRKYKMYFLGIMFIVCTVCQAQRLDIKPYIIYHQSVSTQIEPAFHLFLPDEPNAIMPISSYSNDFTLANGLEYGLAIDYTFRNQLGVELGLGYFNSFARKYNGIFTTNWNSHSFVVRPVFSYAINDGKSAFIGKIGPAIHYVSANLISTKMTASFGSWESSCTFSDKLNWGYSIVLEYNYQLSEQFRMAIELGVERYKYIPNKATVEYKNENGYPIKIEMDYESVDKGKKSISMNSIYLGIGIKYNLRKQ